MRRRWGRPRRRPFDAHGSIVAASASDHLRLDPVQRSLAYGGGVAQPYPRRAFSPPANSFDMDGRSSSDLQHVAAEQTVAQSNFVAHLQRTLD